MERNQSEDGSQDVLGLRQFNGDQLQSKSSLVLVLNVRKSN